NSSTSATAAATASHFHTLPRSATTSFIIASPGQEIAGHLVTEQQETYAHQQGVGWQYRPRKAGCPAPQREQQHHHRQCRQLPQFHADIERDEVCGKTVG